jgi:hypothetical protein
MPSSVIQRGIRLLLSILLIAGNGISPGVTHAHAEGDRPHRHEHHGDGDIVHSHSHRTGDHGHGHHDHGNRADQIVPDDDPCRVEESIAHTHINVFGVPLTLPLKEEGGSQRNQELPVVKVDALAAACVVRANNLPTAGFWISLSALPPCVRSALDNDVSMCRAPQATHIPLCDTARRERSGVLVV